MECAFKGFFPFAPPAVLESAMEAEEWDELRYTPQAADDMQSIVKCVLQSIYPDMIIDLLQQSGERRSNWAFRIKTFWEKWLQKAYWKRMMDAAVACNYAVLSQLIQDFI